MHQHRACQVRQTRLLGSMVVESPAPARGFWTFFDGIGIADVAVMPAVGAVGTSGNVSFALVGRGQARPLYEVFELSEVVVFRVRTILTLGGPSLEMRSPGGRVPVHSYRVPRSWWPVLKCSPGADWHHQSIRPLRRLRFRATRQSREAAQETWRGLSPSALLSQ